MQPLKDLICLVNIEATNACKNIIHTANISTILHNMFNSTSTGINIPSCFYDDFSQHLFAMYLKVACMSKCTRACLVPQAKYLIVSSHNPNTLFGVC